MRNELIAKVQNGELSVAAALDLWDEHKFQAGQWVPGCGGTEVPFVTRSGRRLLYCWHTGSGEHAYIDLDTDLPLTTEEARNILG